MPRFSSEQRGLWGANGELSVPGALESFTLVDNKGGAPAPVTPPVLLAEAARSRLLAAKAPTAPFMPRGARGKGRNSGRQTTAV